MNKAAVAVGAAAAGSALLFFLRPARAASGAPNGAGPADAPSGPAPAPSFPDAPRPPAPPPPPDDFAPAPAEPTGTTEAAPPPDVTPATPPPRDLDPRHALAARTAMRLWELSGDPNQTTDEDRALIEAFQQQEGLIPNGRYMAGTGLAFIKYDIVPPKPFYWPRGENNATNVKANWRSNMLFQATKDPARAEEWQRIAMV